MEKNVEEIEEIKNVIFNLVDSLGEYKKDILDLFAISPSAKSEEELLYQAEGFLEEEIKKGKLSQKLKNKILNLLKKGVSGKEGFFCFLSGKLGTKIDIKDKDSIKKVMENKGLNFDELWDLYIKYLRQNSAIKGGKKNIIKDEEKVKNSVKDEEKVKDLVKNEEKVKNSVLILKKILNLHTKLGDYNGMMDYYRNTSEGLKKNEWKEESLMAESFGFILHIASEILDLPISSEMFRNAIRTDVPVVLFNEELQKKVKDSLSVDPKFISLVNEVKRKIVYEISKLEPTNGLVDFNKKSGGFIYREIDEDSDTIYCRIPIKSFGNKDLQYSIGKVDAYIVYKKDQDGIWKGSLVIDDFYDFPVGDFKSIKGILNKIGNSFQEKGKIMPYHWRISFEMPDITEKDVKTDYSVVA